MRTVAPLIGDQLTALASQPGFLVRVDLPAPNGTVYMCTFDTDFEFNGFTWRTSDLELSGINWANGTTRNVQMRFGDADGVWWRVAAGGPNDLPKLQDAPVYIWQAYADVAGQAVALCNGRIGAVRKGIGYLDCELRADTTWMKSPRRRVQEIVKQEYLLPAGTIVKIGGQKWILGRKQDEAVSSKRSKTINGRPF